MCLNVCKEHSHLRARHLTFGMSPVQLRLLLRPPVMFLFANTLQFTREHQSTPLLRQFRSAIKTCVRFHGSKLSCVKVGVSLI